MTIDRGFFYFTLDFLKIITKPQEIISRLYFSVTSSVTKLSHHTGGFQHSRNESESGFGLVIPKIATPIHVSLDYFGNKICPLAFEPNLHLAGGLRYSILLGSSIVILLYI